MKSFTWKIILCVAPVLLALLIVSRAYVQYVNGQGGFKSGVDHVGVTILVYEVDADKSPPDPATGVPTKPPDWSIQKLASRIKERIDPADLYNITIRPVSDTRMEIILPTGGQHQVAAE